MTAADARGAAPAPSPTPAPAPDEGRLLAFQRADRLVVKVGSSLIVSADGQPREGWMATLVADLAGLARRGRAPVLVSSGAIALGARRLGLSRGGRASLEDAQAAAAAGQIELAGLWARLLAGQGLKAAQMLLTLGDFEDRRRWLNASATLSRLIALKVVPILNENDSVATEEIRFGDNDRLAARAAQAARAGGLLLLSDVAGLMTADPARDAAAGLIATVRDLDAIRHHAGPGSGSGMGSGGMGAKLEAVRIAHAAGIPVAIASGLEDHPVSRFLGHGPSTVFPPPAPFAARKAWLAGRMRVAGRLVVDAGAVRALGEGRSLLAAGVRRVEGRFARGDAVDVVDEADCLVARGLIGYDAADAAAIAGRRSEEAAAILGHSPRSAMIHRDQMVLLTPGPAAGEKAR